MRTALAIVVLVFGAASLRAQSAQPAFTAHNDPSGFSVATPAGWTVARDAQQGRITLRGLAGEQAVIWPMLVEQRQLDSASASALVQDLARKVDPQLVWSPESASAPNLARSAARSTQRSGSAVLAWSNAPSGATVYLYCVEAPSAQYSASTDTFAAILSSFRIAPNSSAPSGAAPAGLAYVRWSDPREAAFTMSVPQGWQVVGGSYRLSPTDIRNGVTMLSPDGQIRIVVGDSNIGLFELPSQVLSMAGLNEGSNYTLGDGTNLLISHLVPGQQFVANYVNNVIARQCAGVKVQSDAARPDLASYFTQSAKKDGMPSAQLTAGEENFTCSLDGHPVDGKFVVVTMVPGLGIPIWTVYRLYGYLAPASREQDAQAICQQAMDSWQIDPQWQAREKQIANQAVAADNARSQQIRQQAMAAIQKDQQETSDMIMKGWEQRNQVYDEISRKRENAILGTVDVVDPETNTTYKIDNYSDYHWMNDAGYIAGTRTTDSPGPGWRELITLP